MKKLAFWVILTVSCFLIGCGGGGDNPLSPMSAEPLQINVPAMVSGDMINVTWTGEIEGADRYVVSLIGPMSSGGDKTSKITVGSVLASDHKLHFRIGVEVGLLPIGTYQIEFVGNGQKVLSNKFALTYPKG